MGENIFSGLIDKITSWLTSADVGVMEADKD